MSKLIDVNFDFQAEAGNHLNGKQRDPDKYSHTLQEYNRILWSKQLPSGYVFTLCKISENRLYHKSELGEFFLSSDRAIATFTRRKRLEHIIAQISKDEIEKFYKIADTIGGIVIWPSNKIDGKMTIKGERGFNHKVSDRLDLTVECIRRYYRNDNSPLFETLKRYSNFFSLFVDFKGYVNFFLLQDIVSDDYATVKMATYFDDFNTSPIPSCVDEYLIYKDNIIKFVELRNARISNLY